MNTLPEEVIAVTGAARLGRHLGRTAIAWEATLAFAQLKSTGKRDVFHAP
jgi:hypothetical protein